MRCKWTVCVRALYVLTLTAALSGCQKDLVETQQVAHKHKVGFYAGGGQTRTTMLPDGLSAEWMADDEIAVWARDSSGSYTLSNQIFKTYGVDSARGFFTSELSSAMPDGMYTYFCCYPVPVSVSGTKATFSIPSVQDGKATGGADIMVATPVQHGRLTGIPELEDHSGMSMKMNRMTHQFRFFVPEENQILGDEKIEHIILTFPKGVTGDVTCDFQDPSVSAESAAAMQADVELKLAQPIGVSYGDDYQFACLALAPVQFEAGDSLQIVKAYTDDKIAFFDPIYLKEKKCEAGHSTPVKLNVRELVDYAGIIYLKLAKNNLGENPEKITLTAPSTCKWGDGGSNVLVYEPGREILEGEVIALKFETDADSYKAFSNQQISVVYESENAIVTETLTMPSITEAYGSTTAFLTVPYLLFEDFSCVYAEGESYGNNSYSGSEQEQPGASLDGCMSHTGWNAARYWTKGNSIRINTRFQCVKIFVAFSSYHHGRLDTPQLTGLKSGKTVNLNVYFDAGGYLHKESSAEVSNVCLNIATHTNTGVLDGIPTGTKGLGSSYSTTLSDFGTKQSSQSLSSDFGDDAFNSSFPTYEAEISKATSSTRIVFYPTFTGTDTFATNAEFNVYIDNIKVQIAK